MLKRTLALTILGIAAQTVAHAQPTTEDILNKRNRRLSPPPHSIKSDKFNPGERFEAALERSQTAVALPDEDFQRRGPAGRGEVTDGSDSSSAVEVLLGSNKRIRDKNVTLGVMGAGLTGLVGMKADVQIPDILWLSGHVGSGVDYTSWGFGVRKYIFPKLMVLPFFDLRYTEWLLKKSEKGTASSEYPFPSYATEKFFRNPYEKQTAHLLSPGLGMAMVDREGLGVEMGAQYLYSLDVNRGALLGSLGLVKYF